MNCKPGDLAIIVGKARKISFDHAPPSPDIPAAVIHSAIGRIVHVLAPAPSGAAEWLIEPVVIKVVVGDWEVNGRMSIVADYILRPIRDTDGADEVNAIAQRKSGRGVKA